MIIQMQNADEITVVSCENLTTSLDVLHDTPSVYFEMTVQWTFLPDGNGNRPDQNMLKSIRLSRSTGGMAEWLKAPVLKTGMGRKLHRGFESLSLRLTTC